MRKLVLLVPIMLYALQCTSPTATDDPELVTSLHFTPSAFDSFRRNSEMKYTLKAPTTVSISIVKSEPPGRELLIKTLVEDLPETKGSHSITWIGDTDQRLFAPAGVYFGLLRVQKQRFETIVQVFHY